MLKDLKVSCKCVFYRPEHNAHQGLHGTEFWRSWKAKVIYQRNAKWNILIGYSSEWDEI